MALTMKDMIETARAYIAAASPLDAHEAAKSGGVLLDVREPGEHSEGRLDGALHIPRGLLEPKADPESGSAEDGLVKHRDGSRIYVLCASGARATLAAHTLCQMGYDACVIEGGMKAWKDAGLPVQH